MALYARLTWRLKRLNYALQRLRGSVALRGWRGTFARIRQEFEHRPTFDDTLHVEPLDVPFAPFVLPTSEQPQVSVIIPIHGKVAYTLACLRSIARHAPNAPFEVIVVDDASPDDSTERLAHIAGLRLLRNERNLGFVGSCNAGAAAAHGNFLLFLNNDTQVTPNWLDGLLRCFAERADCGIAGSRLVYPDGRLQEAGGLVFADGSCWNTGRFEERDAPAWRYRRETDYVSGASLLIRREVFERIGGFDQRYAPAYYEDTDLAFAVRALGLKVYYEPSSTIIHCEGISAGNDLHAGMKRHQVTNQATFVAKWEQALRAQPPVDTSLIRAMRWRRRGRVLVVDSMTPEPARDSGSLRLSAILRLLDEQGWSISFLPDDGRASEDEIRALGALGTEVLSKPWVPDLPHWLRAHGHELHAVMLCRHTVADQYASQVRKLAPKARLLFDTVDLHFLREQRAAELSGNASMARQAQASRKSELALIEQCDVTFVVSPHEQALLAAELPHSRIELLSNIHDVHGCTTGFSQRTDLVFIGGQGHPPNVDAVKWMSQEILPRLREQHPNMRIHVLGDVTDAMREALATPGLELHGRVADLAPWLETSLASLAPLRFGAGVKGKINMAMSYGVPVIATSVAAEGMHLTDGKDVLIANDAAAFADAVNRLLHDEVLWNTLSSQGLDNVRRHFSPEAAARALRQALD
ncbi:Glycosyltransferase, GT2 family [Dyella jiangningensis]|uniref:glycosyltransferase n=1 Tax=Dyella sp. AtDHG13 TaxID=1938897 RepID=UPI0008849E5C|nr:glycosyltransferase [Dyella sp. AtDHG13]PXV57245.1 GT2 family glycosyltransferase [Dyella sp. AtDHG13]SDK36739.1 Glycosyltransferase, GT2 family [Dyella jiangningensis]